MAHGEVRESWLLKRNKVCDKIIHYKKEGVQKRTPLFILTKR